MANVSLLSMVQKNINAQIVKSIMTAFDELRQKARNVYMVKWQQHTNKNGNIQDSIITELRFVTDNFKETDQQKEMLVDMTNEFADFAKLYAREMIEIFGGGIQVTYNFNSRELTITKSNDCPQNAEWYFTPGEIALSE